MTKAEFRKWLATNPPSAPNSAHWPPKYPAPVVVEHTSTVNAGSTYERYWLPIVEQHERDSELERIRRETIRERNKMPYHQDRD